MEILILGLVVTFVGATILRRHLRESKLLRLREIIHTERLRALERGTELPEGPVDELDGLISSLDVQPPPPLMTTATGILWVRLAALCLGLTSLFGGIGVALGLAMVSDPEGSGFWSLGLIPVFVGFGLLLFHRLSKNAVRTGDGDAAE